MANPRDPIGTLVRGEPVSIDEKLTMRSVAAVLGAEDTGAALIERDDGSLGIISEPDVTRALADDADPDVVWSADIMSEGLDTARATEPIMGAALRLIEAGIRHVAVVDDDNRDRHRLVAGRLPSPGDGPARIAVTGPNRSPGRDRLSAGWALGQRQAQRRFRSSLRACEHGAGA